MKPTALPAALLAWLFFSNTAQPTPEGNTVITEAGNYPRLIAISPDGKIVIEFPLTGWETL